MPPRSYIIDDRERKTFLLDREVLVSEEILRQEMSHIFGRCWIYVGHASELKNPGDFRSRKVAGFLFRARKPGLSPISPRGREEPIEKTHLVAC